MAQTDPYLHRSIAPLAWVRENLFNTWYNGILTIICLVVIVQVLISVISWIFGAAQWTVIRQTCGCSLLVGFPRAVLASLDLALIAGVAALSWEM